MINNRKTKKMTALAQKLKWTRIQIGSDFTRDPLLMNHIRFQYKKHALYKQ